MCYVKNSGDLKTFKAVILSLRYLGNPTAESHLFYRVEVPVHLTSGTVPDFVFESMCHRDAYNQVRPKKNAHAGIVTWLIFSFAEGTFLKSKEANFFRKKVGSFVAPRGDAICSRHEHVSSGASDENIFVPTIINDEGKLNPRRSREKNELFRLRHAVARVIAELNEARAAEGRSPIPTPQSRPSKFIRTCAETAKQLNLIPSKLSITEILQRAFPKKTWYFDADEYLCFPPKKKHGRTKRVPTVRFLRLILQALKAGVADPSLSALKKEDENNNRDTVLSKLHGGITVAETTHHFSSSNAEEFEPEI